MLVLQACWRRAEAVDGVRSWCVGTENVDCSLRNDLTSIVGTENVDCSPRNDLTRAHSLGMASSPRKKMNSVVSATNTPAMSSPVCWPIYSHHQAVGYRGRGATYSRGRAHLHAPRLPRHGRCMRDVVPARRARAHGVSTHSTVWRYSCHPSN
jgi:hypothetical protein